MSKTYKLIIFHINLFILTSFNINAQVLSANQPEQDPCNALVFCGLTYNNPYSYSGVGAQSLNTTPCGAGEDNSVWIKLTISTAGTVVFKITPNVSSDDYDFAVLNGTNTLCSNLNSNNVIRCNFNNNSPVYNNGIIGLSTNTSVTSVQAGATGSSYVAAINASVGDIYYIMINNAGNGQGQGNSSGFSLNFTGSTATFNQGPLPYLDSIIAPYCTNANYLNVRTTKQVLCNSIASNGSDFYITPTVANVTSAVGANCTNTNGYSTNIKVNFNSALPPGDYVLHMATGADNNTLLDFCGQQVPVSDTLHFKVYKLIDTITKNICQAQLPYLWNGISVTSGGTAVATYHTTSHLINCDSVTYLNLVVTQTYNNSENITICSNLLPYTWHNIVVSSGGTNVATYHTTTSAGCDSNIHLNLHVKNNVYNSIHDTICQGGSVIFNGNSYNANTTGITGTFPSSSGCDSIVTFNLYVRPNITHTTNDTICQGGSVIFNGNSYNTSTTGITGTFTSSLGCDSIVTFNLYVKPTSSSIVHDTICQGNSISFNGTNYSTSVTNITGTFTNAVGCDSVVNFNLYVKPISNSYIYDTICQGGNVIFNGNSYNSNVTNITATFANSLGCDSIVHFNLHITDSIFHYIHDTICQGSSIVYNGTTYTTNVSGITTHYPSALGCDSAVIFSLFVKPIVTHTTNDTICQGGSVIFNGNSYNSNVTGITGTFTSSSGCDSIVTFNLYVKPTSSSIIHDTICQGSSISFNGINYSTSVTNITGTFTNSVGCDSVVNFNLYVKPTIHDTTTLEICSNQLPTTWNNITIPANASTTNNYTSYTTQSIITQCDSVTTLNLIVHPAFNKDTNIYICYNHSITINGQSYSADTNLTVNVPTVYGCDSVLHTHIFVSPQPQSTTIDKSQCGSLTFEGKTYTESTNFTDTLYTIHGCDSLYRNIVITVWPVNPTTVQHSFEYCDSTIYNGTKILNDTTYTDTFRNVNGCDSLYNVYTFKIHHFDITLQATNDTVFVGNPVTLAVSANESFIVSIWNPATLFSNQSATSQTVYFYNNQTIIVTANDSFGCVDTASISIYVLSEDDNLKLPNAFSPNGDGVNDVFRPKLYTIQGYNIESFQIFNRWGQLIYNGAGNNAAWDGTYGGKPAENGVYYYLLKAATSDKEKTFKGDVTLIR